MLKTLQTYKYDTLETSLIHLHTWSCKIKISNQSTNILT